MLITMVKKMLADGSPCRKCIQAEEMLKRRKLWDKIDEIVVANESDPNSEGFQRAKRYGIDTAPFFIVQEGEEEPDVINSSHHSSICLPRGKE